MASTHQYNSVWLATHRLAGQMVRAAGGGVVGAATLALVMGALARRGRRPLWIGIVCFGLVWITGLAALAFPFRETAFVLHRFSSHALTRTVFGLIAAASLLLLAGRSWDALSRAGDSGNLGVLTRFRFVIAVLAAASVSLTLIPWVLLPRLSPARASGRPSVILVSIDTLRADRLGVLGSARPRTPLLDGIATEGMVCEQALSAAPWTLP